MTLENTSFDAQRTSDLLAGAAQSIVAKRDLRIPAPKAAVLEKARKMKVSEISRTGENLTAPFPQIDEQFSQVFSNAIDKLASDTEATGAHVVQAYETAVHAVRARTTNQFGRIMFGTMTVVDLFDYFNIPLNEAALGDLERQSPAVAHAYREKAKMWMEGV